MHSKECERTKISGTAIIEDGAAGKQTSPAPAACERNEDGFWASCPAVKQDGGQRGTLCQTTEGGERQRERENRTRLRAVLPTEQRGRENGRRTERGRVRESSESYLNRAGSAWRRQHPREKAVLLSVCGRGGLLAPLHLCPGHVEVLL